MATVFPGTIRGVGGIPRMPATAPASTDKVLGVKSVGPLELEWKDAGGGGGGDVTKVGTPANDQLGVWTGDGTIEGTSNLRFGHAAGGEQQITIGGDTVIRRNAPGAFGFYDGSDSGATANMGKLSLTANTASTLPLLIQSLDDSTTNPLIELRRNSGDSLFSINADCDLFLDNPDHADHNLTITQNNLMAGSNDMNQVVFTCNSRWRLNNSVFVFNSERTVGDGAWNLVDFQDRGTSLFRIIGTGGSTGCEITGSLTLVGTFFSKHSSSSLFTHWGTNPVGSSTNMGGIYAGGGTVASANQIMGMFWDGSIITWSATAHHEFHVGRTHGISPALGQKFSVEAATASRIAAVFKTNDNSTSNNLTEWHDSSDAVLFAIAADGTAEMDQGSNDDGFINFKATTDADSTSAISTLTTSGATTHHIQVEINGTKAWIAASTNAPS